MAVLFREGMKISVMKIGIDMKYNYLILTIVSFALLSCAREGVDAPETITIRAWQEGATETKTTLIDGGTQVYWEPSDEINVFFNGSGSRFISQNTENADIADFSGALNVLVGINEGASGSNSLWGVYPYRSDVISDGESVTTTLPTEQIGRAGSFAKGVFITLAKSNSFDLAFYNVCGGIRFSVTQEGVKKVVFQGQNDEAIAGKVKLTFVNGIPAVKEIIDGQKTITLTAPNGGTFETGKWYYIVTLPGTLSNGFKITFNTTTQTATLKSSGSKTIKRGIFGSLADADEDLVYKDNSDVTNPDDFIQFKDPAAKYACVEKFDKNGDGEVSYEEAAAAKTLSGLFTNWNTVTSFDEIKYFTGVTSTSGVFTGLTKLESITIPDNIKTLGSFEGCISLKRVTLPSNLTSLPAYCFRSCSSLTSVSLPLFLSALPNSCFSYCSSLETIALPSSITSLGKECFRDCQGLSSLVLPSGLKEIASGAFMNCSNLLIITWPLALESIGADAFSNCASIGNDYTLMLPETVTSIESKAFKSFRHIIVPSTVPVSISPYSFDFFTFVYVPESMVNMYKVRTNWSLYADRIRPISDYPAEPSVGGTIGEAIDLGLSVKWASWNLGATRPDEYGAFIAWGETNANWDYLWSTYKWYNGTDGSLTKYNTNRSYGTVDNLTVLEPEDDAATHNWGGSWRMPTKDELDELLNTDNCTWTESVSNGVKGYLVTSKKEGFTDKSIFIPCAGDRHDGSHNNAGSIGYYWTSSIVTNAPKCAYYSSPPHRVSYSQDSLYYGRSIRPVCD